MTHYKEMLTDVGYKCYKIGNVYHLELERIRRKNEGKIRVKVKKVR